jgi:glycosyltransferase involved in cell wall biosynthesis
MSGNSEPEQSGLPGGAGSKTDPVSDEVRQPGEAEYPLVSVVITCYNQAQFLAEAIESVLGQGYPRFEAVVIDDGSQDDPAQVAARYRDVRFIRQQNQGVSAARNAGLCEGRGAYVVFLDADDRLLPGALETGVRSHQANPSAGFVYGQYRAIGYDGAPSNTPPQTRVDAEHYTRLLRGNYIVLPGMVMHRREVLEGAGGWDRSSDHAGDWELYLRIARRFPVYCHHQPVVEYRLHGANTSHNHALMLTRSLAALRTQRAYLHGNKKYREAYKAGVRTLQNSYGELLFEQVRADMRARRWALRRMLVLLRYYPQSLAKHAYRKLALLWGGGRSVSNS